MIHGYKLCGYNIVLDVAGGAVHSVDDVVFDVMLLYQLILDGKDPSVLFSRLKEKHPQVTQAETDAIIADVEKLIKQGKLYSEDTYDSVASKVASREVAVKALCLNVSHACNMDCAYCFAGVPLYAAQMQDALNADAFMSLDTGKQAIDFLIANSKDITNLDVDFFGGEPLLNWQTVKDIVAYARTAERQTSKKFRFTLTTNGLLIDDDVIAFTNREMHTVVLSLDGRPETHDAMRKLPGGGGTYEEVLAKFKKLVEARRHKGYYIRGTYTRENMDFPGDIFHIADELGFKEVSLEPAVSKPGSRFAFTQSDLDELLRQYDMLAVEMHRRKQMRIDKNKPERNEFNFYHYMLDLTGGPCLKKRIAGCGVGVEYLAVTPGGELYPCHQFIGDRAFYMGHVKTGVNNNILREQFKAANIYSIPECKSCWARFYCSSGCAANAYHDTGSINGVYKFGCELFKKRIENAIMLKL